MKQIRQYMQTLNCGCLTNAVGLSALIGVLYGSQYGSGEAVVYGFLGVVFTVLVFIVAYFVLGGNDE